MLVVLAADFGTPVVREMIVRCRPSMFSPVVSSVASPMISFTKPISSLNGPFSAIEPLSRRCRMKSSFAGAVVVSPDEKSEPATARTVPSTVVSFFAVVSLVVVSIDANETFTRPS